MPLRFIAMVSCLLGLSITCVVQAAERKDVRVLYDFEDPSDLEDLKKNVENVVLDTVQDNGVTHGKNCCRLVFNKPGDYGVLNLGREKIKNWGNFDYFAMDVFMEREGKVGFAFELWDGLTKGYPTRCTVESLMVKQGKNSIVIPINRAKRNGKEGRDWSELEPNDKIQMNALTRVKMFLDIPKDGNLVWWVDNLRVLQEDALGGKMKVEVPAGAAAFLFGHRAGNMPEFIVAEKPGADARGFTLSGNIANCGKHWPDPLTGDGVYDPSGGILSFEKTLPDGEYYVWLAAGMTIKSEVKNPHFLLKIGDETIVDDKPTADEFASEKYLFRFLKTQYSERENALYLDFIDRMYPVYEKKVKVTGGKLKIEAANHFLASLLVLPAAQEAAFKKMSADIRAERIRTFYSTVNLDQQKKPLKKGSDGDFLCFIPDEKTGFNAATGPSDDERKHTAYDLAAAPGQRVVFRAGIVPFKDVGKCKLEVSALKGPGEIPATATRVYFEDYRLRGDAMAESALMPTNELNAEKGVTFCWYMWLKVPDDAAAGDYSGLVTITPLAGGKAVSFPVKLKVYPFKLEEILPYSFGMYYSGHPDKKKLAEQIAFMREIGFTGLSVGGGNVTAVNGASVDVNFDATPYELAKAAGMGRHPMQFMMGNSLGAARAIGRRLGAKVDQNPGSEFNMPGLKPAYLDFCHKYAEFIKKQGLPVAVEIVDEPREVPNPWNRNLKDTNTYGDWLKEGGIFPSFVTPMGDGGSMDYTSLIDHADIISTHAGKGSEKLMTQTPQKKKMLWLYNTGMDRLSWGFYNWRVGSVGRWEWHFCFSEGGSNFGYINEEEWYNPFTSCDGFAPHGPNSYPGAMLFKTPFLSCAEGITDSAYIVTLEKAIATAEGNAAKADAVAKAKAFLDALKKTIPFLPGVKNIASEAEGALVGTGLNAEGTDCEVWRRKCADLIIALK